MKLDQANPSKLVWSQDMDLGFALHPLFLVFIVIAILSRSSEAMFIIGVLWLVFNLAGGHLIRTSTEFDQENGSVSHSRRLLGFPIANENYSRGTILKLIVSPRGYETDYTQYFVLIPELITQEKRVFLAESLIRKKGKMQTHEAIDRHNSAVIDQAKRVREFWAIENGNLLGDSIAALDEKSPLHKQAAIFLKSLQDRG